MGTQSDGSKNYSEQTAQRIDKKIHEIVQAQYERSLEILNEHRAALDTMADALLEHETIDGVHVKEILDHGKMLSPVIKREIEAVEPEPEEADAGAIETKTGEDDDKDGLAADEAPAPSPA